MTDGKNCEDALANREAQERSGFEDLRRVLDIDRSERLGSLAPLVGMFEWAIAAILRHSDWPARR